MRIGGISCLEARSLGLDKLGFVALAFRHERKDPDTTALVALTA